MNRERRSEDEKGEKGGTLFSTYQKKGQHFSFSLSTSCTSSEFFFMTLIQSVLGYSPKKIQMVSKML